MMRIVALAPDAAASASVADHGLRASAGWPGTRESDRLHREHAAAAPASCG